MTPIKLNLSNENFKWIASQIHPRCEPEMIIAFTRVECKREPFDKDGFPAILYERHIVYDAIFESNPAKAKELARKYPSLIYPTGYGKGGYGSYSDQRAKLAKCIAILQSEGLSSDFAYAGCSYGPFQELAINWRKYGFKSVTEFVETMKNGLFGACDIFIRSIKQRGLVNPMLNHQFDTLAERYNGKGYRQFNYAGQLTTEYDHAKKLHVNWDAVNAVAPAKATKSAPPIENLHNVDVDAHIEPDDSHVTPAPELQHDAPDEKHTDDEENALNGQQPATNASLEIKDGNVKIEANAENKPPEKIAVIEKPSRLQYIWHKLTTMIAGNIGLDGLFEYWGKVQALGLPASFWSNIIWFIVIGCIIGLIVLLVRWYMDKQQTLKLVEANSTPDNKATIASIKDVENLKANGYKLIYQTA